MTVPVEIPNDEELVGTGEGEPLPPFDPDIEREFPEPNSEEE